MSQTETDQLVTTTERRYRVFKSENQRKSIRRAVRRCLMQGMDIESIVTVLNSNNQLVCKGIPWDRKAVENFRTRNGLSGDRYRRGRSFSSKRYVKTTKVPAQLELVATNTTSREAFGTGKTTVSTRVQESFTEQVNDFKVKLIRAAMARSADLNEAANRLQVHPTYLRTMLSRLSIKDSYGMVSNEALLARINTLDLDETTRQTLVNQITRQGQP